MKIEGKGKAGDLPTYVIGVDPGREKCGVAVLSREADVLEQAIVGPDEVLPMIRRWEAQGACLVVVGSGTGSTELCRRLRDLASTVELVPEENTSAEGRKRYLREHPPRGWRRLIPAGLRYPDRPYDDFVAILIAEKRIREMSA